MVTRLAAAFIWSSFLKLSSVLAWPAVISPRSSMFCMSSGRFKSRSAFVIAGRDLPTVFAISSCVNSKLSISIL